MFVLVCLAAKQLLEIARKEYLARVAEVREALQLQQDRFMQAWHPSLPRRSPVRTADFIRELFQRIALSEIEEIKSGALDHTRPGATRPPPPVASGGGGSPTSPTVASDIKPILGPGDDVEMADDTAAEAKDAESHDDDVKAKSGKAKVQTQRRRRSGRKRRASSSVADGAD